MTVYCVKYSIIWMPSRTFGLSHACTHTCDRIVFMFIMCVFSNENEIYTHTRTIRDNITIHSSYFSFFMLSLLLFILPSLLSLQQNINVGSHFISSIFLSIFFLEIYRWIFRESYIIIYIESNLLTTLFWKVVHILFTKRIHMFFSVFWTHFI